MEQVRVRQEDIAPFDISKIIQLVLRRKWLIIFMSIAIMIAGFAACLFLPLKYEASALIVAVPQKVPETYVHSTVTGNINDQIRSILQEVTSRTSMEKLIKKFNLYPELRKKYPLENVIERMREDIHVEEAKITGYRQRYRSNGLRSFYIKYQGTNPVQVAKVTNALANMFVEQNLKLRTSQAEATAKFLETQLQKLYMKLKEREEALKNFKMAHMGELPEQTPSNLATLNALQQQLQTLEENIRRAEDRVVLLRQQLAAKKTEIRAEASAREEDSASLDKYSLDELKERLRLLRSRYTENHPDIIALKKAIKAREMSMGSRRGRSGGRYRTGNSALDAIRFQLESTQLEIKQMKDEREKLKAEIAKYQKRIEDAPKLEQQLVDLTRDYENLKRSYDSLLQRKLEAEQAAALERRQQGAQFKIIDPALVPEEPVSPKLKRILPLIFLAAFAGPLAFAFLLDFLSPRFYDPDDIKKTFALPVLACIPILLTDEEIRQRRIKTIVLSLCAISGYSVAAALLAVIFTKGPGIFSGLL